MKPTVIGFAPIACRGSAAARPHAAMMPLDPRKIWRREILLESVITLFLLLNGW
jgi:hypothetical protein